MDYYAHLSTPLGPMLLRANEVALTGLYFSDQKDCPQVAGSQPLVGSPISVGVGVNDEATMRKFRVLSGASQGTLAHTAQGTDLAPMARFNELQGQSDASRLTMSDDTPATVRILFEEASRQLQQYFCGARKHFELALNLLGSAFQQSVWSALLNVPYGEVLTYGELGRSAGLPAGHGRAVGSAVGRNPIAIIVPCHRVLASGAQLNGYTGGLRRKLSLLQLEGLHIATR